MDSAVLVAAIGVFSLTIAGLFKLIGDQNKSHEKMADAFEKMAESNKDIAIATNRGADEAKERNGHLGEQNLQIVELIKDTREDLKEHIDNIKEQHVGKQIVDEMSVKYETVEHQDVKK